MSDNSSKYDTVFWGNCKMITHEQMIPQNIEASTLILHLYDVEWEIEFEDILINNRYTKIEKVRMNKVYITTKNVGSTIHLKIEPGGSQYILKYKNCKYRPCADPSGTLEVFNVIYNDLNHGVIIGIPIDSILIPQIGHFKVTNNGWEHYIPNPFKLD